MGNWEKRSQYLLTEIVKYESYIDSLQTAMSLRLKKRGEKALEKALVEHAVSSKARWKGPDEETIEEGEEPPPSGKLDPMSSHFHRREYAED
jgi:PH and SEC7 domain-containing protein